MYTSTNFDQTVHTGTGPLARYNGAETIVGIPSRNDIVAEFDNKTTPLIQQSLPSKQPIHFIPTEVSDDTEYVNGIFTYILRITKDEMLGTLILHCIEELVFLGLVNKCDLSDSKEISLDLALEHLLSQ
ncbi:hypothetical protein C2G38_2222245 [Gigaspora rosea]|uniref:Uncharacterized protein n=1 Tax=Gigaspora rosea TaxID=44941 RepID=A0A397U617_9GLOM|nr:hypothetical protein C2G38_2222245 [Gigaspora rosea]